MTTANTPLEPYLRIGFLLAPRFTLSAFANFVDMLRLAADEGDRSRPIRCQWRVLSTTMEPIASSSSVSVRPDERLGDPTRFDYLVVVGGLIDEIERLPPEYEAFLRRAATQSVPLVGLCTGAFILHRAGLMQGYRCCVSWFHHDDFLREFDGLEPVADQIYVADRDRLTCAGGASAAHLAAHLVERHLGKAAALKSLHIMIMEEAPSEAAPQPGAPIALKSQDPLVRKALLIAQQRLDAPPSVTEAAEALGVSRRRLERRFQDELNLSPARAFLLIRLGFARHLLRDTEKSITEIALETGFCDLSHFIRSFRKEESLTPETWRRAKGGSAQV